MSILLTILILGVMIFVHELGHFVAARRFGVHVEEFAIGMGPAILRKQRGDTLYSVRLIPLGGFCRMEGEDEASDSPGAFSSLVPWKRLIVLAAGAAMNVALAFLLFVSVCFMSGETTNTIRAFAGDDVPAAVFAEGDKIIKIDNTRIHIYNDIALKMANNGGEAVEVTVQRGGETLTKTITPYLTERGYQLGVYLSHEKGTLPKAIKNGWHETTFSVKSVYWGLKQLVTGHIGLESMSGPVGVVSVVNDAVRESRGIENARDRRYALLLYVLDLMAFIGANLGVMNLLPLPALDGGRIVFTAIELVSRRKVPQRLEAAVHAAGLIILLIFSLVVTYSDVVKQIK